MLCMIVNYDLIFNICLFPVPGCVCDTSFSLGTSG